MPFIGISSGFVVEVLCIGYVIVGDGELCLQSKDNSHIVMK